MPDSRSLPGSDRIRPSVSTKCLNRADGHDAMKEDFNELRTLRVSGSKIVYEAKAAPAREGEAVLYMIDGAMNARKPPADYPLFELEEWVGGS